MPTASCFDLIVYARLLGKQLLAREIDAATAAMRLLQTLLYCAHRRQGALLLCLPEQHSREVAHMLALHFPPVEDAMTYKQQWYLLAVQQMNIQHLLQILPSLHTQEATRRTTPLKEGGVYYPLPITLPSQLVLEELAGGDTRVSDDELPESFMQLPSSATLLMMQPSGDVQHVTEPDAPDTLPLCVQEAAGTALMTMFLALFSLHTSSSGGNFIQAESQDTLSHELRSPLAAIRGYTNTLLRYEHHIEPEERRAFLQEIDEASSHLASLVDHLIELSQLEAGTLFFAFRPLNLTTLAEQALLSAQSRWEQHVYAHAQQPHFSLRLEDEDTVGELLVYADEQRLREVVDMLLDNAIKYSPQGGEIEIVLRRLSPTNFLLKQERNELEPQDSTRKAHEPAEAFIELCVRDHGIGIPSQQLQRIFHRFHRVDMSLTREVSGLGLGLTLCKHIIQKHRGFIWIESTLGMGSTVHVIIPAYQENGIYSL